MQMRASRSIPRVRPTLVAGVCFLSLVVVLFTWIIIEEIPVVEAYHSVSAHYLSQPDDVVATKPPPPNGIPHPIDDLIEIANRQHAELLLKEKRTVADAAAEYRTRRGRHPPPGFNEWFEYAKNKDSFIIEDFFDRIYDDLEPFWAVDPHLLRTAAASTDDTINIRNGAIVSKKGSHQRLGQWYDMINNIVKFLPDVDLCFNIMDEPRVFISAERIANYLTLASGVGRHQPSEAGVSLAGLHESFSPLPSPKDADFKFPWSTNQHVWRLTQNSCPENSPGRKAAKITDLAYVPKFPEQPPAASHFGFVMNWTTSKSPCENPHVQGLHGAFIEEQSIRVTSDVFPIFSGNKMTVNNDILVPPAQDWHNQELVVGNIIDWYTWQRKGNSSFWRGTASGGHNRGETWRRFHRHRFVAMSNGTQIQTAIETRSQFADTGAPSQLDPRNFPLHQLFWEQHSMITEEAQRDLGTANIAVRQMRDTATEFPAWVAAHTEAGFTDLLCDFPQRDGGCAYNGRFFKLLPRVKEHKMFKHKYLPDIDGNGLSGRFRAFLSSSSLPIKATIFEQWSDSRLTPWKHFVPMHNDMMDFWGILEYFIGIEGVSDAHDEEAERIAMEGSKWARRVLRREDMLIYMYRLILEFARVSSNDRQLMAYVEDLKIIADSTKAVPPGEEIDNGPRRVRRR